MDRRHFLLRTLTTGAVLGAASLSLDAAAALQKVDPKDPIAISLGYNDDTTKVDKAKYPKHEVTQKCSGCQFYASAQEVGKIAPCAIFAGKGVAAEGWCSGYAKKAG